jgi:hypothetical protein
MICYQALLALREPGRRAGVGWETRPVAVGE